MYSQEEYYHKADHLMRISCGAVQDVFRDTWKRRTGSEWTETSASDLITGDGEVFYSNCNGPQKRLLEEGKVEDWDLTLLSGLLKCLASQGHHGGNWKLKKAALCNLCEERNKLAHNARKKIKTATYQQVEATVRVNLSKLGVKKEKVDNWISDAEVAFSNSSGALEQARKLEELGDKEYSRRNYQGARVHYDEALLVPRLPQLKLSTLHEKRASCLLELGMRDRNVRKQTGFYDQATKDIGEALSNSPESSWNAHFIQAKIYKVKNELKKAIEHLEEALAISPSQIPLKEELDNWKLTHGDMARQEHMVYALEPQSLEEDHANYLKSTGTKCSLEEYLHCKNKHVNLFPGLVDLSAGNAFSRGWGMVEKSHKDAARHYENTMAQGSVDGIYKLAMLYLDGKGVPRNISYAIELLKKAAGMQEKSISTDGTGVICVSAGVRLACHALGVHHQEGVGVGQDYKKAVDWYTKAAKSGCADSANALAIMYSRGEGVPQDWKMAEMYWKQAAAHGEFSAAHGLSIYYIDEGESELATFWLEKAILWGHFTLPFIKDFTVKRIADMSSCRKELEIPVKKFEREHGLSPHGLTFMQRHKRMWVATVYQSAKELATANDSDTAKMEAEEVAKNFAKYFNPKLIGFGDSNQNSELEWTEMRRLTADSLDVISKRGEEGSVTAQRMMTVSAYIDNFYQLWNEGRPEENATALIDLVYQITCLEPHLFYFTSDEMEDEFKCFIRSQFESHGSQKGDLDMKLRICYAMYANDRGKHFGIAVLKEGIRRYPNELVYYDQLSCLYGRAGEYKEGLELVDQGLGRFPHDAGLLYNKALHTRLLQARKGKAISEYEDTVQQLSILRSTYEDFLKVASEDHRKLPEAYYGISQSYWDEMIAAKASKTLDEKEKHCAAAEDRVLEFYEMGKRAEEKQLSFYLPYESRTKALLIPWVQVQSIIRGTYPSKTEEKSGTWDVTLPKFITKNIEHMKDPVRIQLVRQHRKNVRDYIQKISRENVFSGYTEVPTCQQKLPKSLAGLQAITLQEMNYSQETIHEGKVLNLTLIEDPMMVLPIETVVIDANRDTIRFGVFNVPLNEETERRLGFGTRLSILNPFIRRCVDGGTAIRVDEPNCIFYLDKVESMCRYCGQDNAKYSCGKCGWAKYCDRECQVADWKELKHKYICKPKSNTQITQYELFIKNRITNYTK